jgi:hypothetical protein
MSKNISYEIMFYGDWTHEINDMCNDMLAASSGKSASKIRVINPFTWDHQINDSAVILIKTFQSLLRLNQKSKLNADYYRTLKFLVYCQELKDINEMFYIPKPKSLDYSSNSISLYQYFLLSSHKGYSLLTFDYFVPNHCNLVQYMILNTYDKDLKNWTRKMEIPEKFTNFNGCSLTVEVTNKHMGTQVDELGIAHGKIPEMFDAMSKIGNFVPKVQIRKTEGPIPIGYKAPQAHYEVWTTLAQSIRKTYHMTTRFQEEKMTVVLTPYGAYTSFEKMIMTFDTLTWILTLVVFLCAFCTIFVVNLCSKRVQNIFYGKRVKTRVLNVVSTFFGIQQHRLPVSNFPRILLMIFVLFCLIMRTGYQGVLFELVATDKIKPSPKTFQELKEQGYIMFVEQNKEYSVTLIPEEYRLGHKIDIEEFHNQ